MSLKFCDVLVDMSSLHSEFGEFVVGLGLSHCVDESIAEMDHHLCP